MSNYEANSGIRKVLRSEITWAISLILGVMGFVSTVVIPINNLQIQVTQIQKDLSSSNEKYTVLMNKVNDVENLENITSTKLEEHLKFKK